MYFIKETLDANGRDAGSKAVADVNVILERNGANSINVICERTKHGLRLHIFNAMYIRQNIKEAGLQKKDTLFLQTPLRAHTVFLSCVIRKLQRDGIKVVLLVHDLNFIRSGNKVRSKRGWNKRIYIEEISILKCADAVIVHNEQMKKLLFRYGITEKKMISLKIFDYLMDRKKIHFVDKKLDRECRVVIAGNLIPEKSGYVYKLPQKVEFVLYGENYVMQDKANVHYMGSFLPEELPFVVEGDFGLVWDGDSIDSCSGDYGEYLRYNSPHKTSLYLACGLPVITWREAAISDFIRQNNVGILLESLNELQKVLQGISMESYMTMKRNAEKLAITLMEGGFLEKALRIIG